MSEPCLLKNRVQTKTSEKDQQHQSLNFHRPDPVTLLLPYLPEKIHSSTHLTDRQMAHQYKSCIGEYLEKEKKEIFYDNGDYIRSPKEMREAAIRLG